MLTLPPARPPVLHHVRRGSRIWAAPWLLLVAALGGCSGGGETARPPTNAAAHALPRYGPIDASLFDDHIDASAVGIADVAARPGTDATLRARTQAAEAVARVRVSTVSVESAGGRAIYHLSLSFVDRFVNEGFSDGSIELSVRPDAPAFGIVKWLDTGLIGRTFIGFFRRYRTADEPQVRFHLSPDTPEVAAAVTLAKALRDVRGK